MDKRTLKALLVLIILNLIGLAYFFLPKLLVPKDIVRLAVCLPLDSAKGQMMLNGIQLYMTHLKESDRQLYHRIDLKIYNDHDNPSQAGMTAQQICSENQALMVLGHHNNQAALAAGKVYRRYGMLAITGSATSKAITRDNEWFFSTVPDQSFQAAVMGVFLKSEGRPIHLVQHQPSVFSTALEATFKNAGVQIEHKWRFRTQQDLKRVISQLNSIDPSGAFLVLAMDAKDTRTLLASLDNRENWSLMISALPSDMIYSNSRDPLPNMNGIYALAPFQIDVADNQAYTFRDTYVKHFGSQPSWEAASYYDAIRLTVEAIKQTPFKSSDTLLQKRKKLRLTFEGYNTRKRSHSGLTGPLYFNRYGCVERPYTLGRFTANHFKPTYTQYHVAKTISENLIKKVLSGQAIRMGSHIWQIKNVVYCGMDLLHISSPDFQHSTFETEFNVWFRFGNYIHVDKIIFPDATSPIKLGQPIAETVQDGITTRTYHVQATFQNQFDFRGFPFDRHLLTIRFHHRTASMDNLVYIPVSSTSFPDQLSSVGAWRIDQINAAHDTITHMSTLGNPDYIDEPLVISQSQFNNRILISQSHIFSRLTIMIWLVIATLILSAIYWISFQSQQFTFVLIAMAFCTGVFNHIIVGSQAWVNYLTFTDYLFFAFYGLVCMTFIYALIIHRETQNSNSDAFQRIVYAGRVFNVLFIVLSVGGYVWCLNSLQMSILP